jgi:hypothetical protein
MNVTGFQEIVMNPILQLIMERLYRKTFLREAVKNSCSSFLKESSVEDDI